MKTIEKHNSAGWVALFGLPFFVAGLACLYAVLEPSVQWNGDRPPLYFGIPFCSVFIFLGGAIMFGRGGYVFDPLRRSGHTYWGLLVPMFYKHFSFDEVDYVLVDSEVRQNKNSSYTVYIIKLILRDKKIIKIENNGRQYLPIKERAEKIARECSLRFLNKKEGGEIIESSEVDKSFRDKLSADYRCPSEPSGSRIKYSDNGMSFQIDSDYSSTWIGQMIPFIFALCFFVPVETFLLYHMRDIGDPVFKYPFIAITCLPITLIFFKQLLTKSSKYQILISKGTIRVFYDNILKTTHKINVDEIDDVLIVDNRSLRPSKRIGTKMFSIAKHGVYIISGEKVYGLNQVKDKEDEKYLFDLIMYGISRH